MGPKSRLTYTILIAVIIATLYFLYRAFDGATLVLESGRQLGGLYINVIIFIIIIMIVLQTVRAVLAKTMSGISAPGEESDEIEEDERDIAIEARGDRIGYYALCFGLLILVVQYCLNDLYPDRWYSFLTLDRPIEWAVAVTLIMFLSDIIKWGSMAISYRA